MSLMLSEGFTAGTRGSVWIRTAAGRDVAGLSTYFTALSQQARYDRFMGTANNLAKIASDCLMHGCRADRFTLVAELRTQGRDTIIAEVSYAFDREQQCGEFAISVADRWQRQGLGAAMLSALQLRAVSLGYFGLFGETLKTNQAMQGLARKAGFEFSRSPDWRAIRFEKLLVA
jgi:RimJ/RimL family protein N-acetyltransferase